MYPLPPLTFVQYNKTKYKYKPKPNQTNKMSQQVNIVAPSDMEEGYQFDAQVDGRTVSTERTVFYV
jgi:hypothetical protein